jgi:hypothetical protein
MTTKANITIFHDHTLQDVLALFLINPDLYKDYTRCRIRQDYFFEQFSKFAAKYYQLTGDECTYFGSVRKELSGEVNICGGAGKQSGASSRYFKKRYRDGEESREKRIADFAKKYGVRFDTENTDPRLFLGVTEIWNKLDRALDIVAASKWSNVRDRSYDDATFAAPFPSNLDKILVPLDIRNRVMQKYRNTAYVATSHRPRIIDVDEEEREYIAKKTEVVDTADCEIRSNIVFVPPTDLDENEW